MAVTARELEAELDAQDTRHSYIVSRHIPEENGGLEDAWYVSAVAGPNKGKSAWVKSTTADSAANQAAAVLSLMVTPGPV